MFLEDFLQYTLSGAVPAEKEWTSPTNKTKLTWLEEGLLEITPSLITNSKYESILLSAGVHGNETAPIEMLNNIVMGIVNEKIIPVVPLLVIFGNPNAMRANKRFLSYDLNRVFSPTTERTELPEVPRAKVIMHHTETFFAKHSGPKIHLDLHTAIRGSIIEKFALSPVKLSNLSLPIINLLKESDISALVIQSVPSGSTFSVFTNTICNAESLTLELGKARPFGQNGCVDISKLEKAITMMLSHGLKTSFTVCKDTTKSLSLFEAKQAIVRGHNEFTLNLADDVENFTELEVGYVVAQGTIPNNESDDECLKITQVGTRILFPNPLVAPGLRAGLLLTPVEENSE